MQTKNNITNASAATTAQDEILNLRHLLVATAAGRNPTERRMIEEKIKALETGHAGECWTAKREANPDINYVKSILSGRTASCVLDGDLIPPTGAKCRTRSGMRSWLRRQTKAVVRDEKTTKY